MNVFDCRKEYRSSNCSYSQVRVCYLYFPIHASDLLDTRVLLIQAVSMILNIIIRIRQSALNVNSSSQNMSIPSLKLETKRVMHVMNIGS